MWTSFLEEFSKETSKQEASNLHPRVVYEMLSSSMSLRQLALQLRQKHSCVMPFQRRKNECFVYYLQSYSRASFHKSISIAEDLQDTIFWKDRDTGSPLNDQKVQSLLHSELREAGFRGR